MNLTFTPRWVILIADLLLCIIGLVIGYIVKYNFDLDHIIVLALFQNMGIVVFLNLLVFLSTHTYRGMIKHLHAQDLLKVILAVLTTHVVLWMVNVFFIFYYNQIFISNSVLVVSFLSTSFLLIFFRLSVRYVFQQYREMNLSITKVLLVGNLRNCISLKRLLEADLDNLYRVRGILAMDRNPLSAKIEGVAVYRELDGNSFIKQNAIDKVFFCDHSIDKKERIKIIQICLDNGVGVLDFPVQGILKKDYVSLSKQIQNIRIEELLERNPIKLNNEKITSNLAHKTILITGAAGSIGSEIVGQLFRHNIGKIICLDFSEAGIFKLKQALQPDINSALKYVIGDVRNPATVEQVFKEYKPDIVFHSAAYKHVPLMEENPLQAFQTNVLGTTIVANAAIKFKTQKMIYVSTDKAVNPSSIMGATKRLAEIYTQSLSMHDSENKTRFITTRFGNVLGSSGSVITQFREQINQGGPVKVTHPEINRYFMTIPEACRLVIEAGMMGDGGEIYMFDMGEPIKIVDLARKMIQLSGYKVDEEIKIQYIGLRPGEKLYEDMFDDKENIKPTKDSKIMIAMVKQYDFKQVEKKLEIMQKAFNNHNIETLVKNMKSLIPEYQSKNSTFCHLD